MPYHIKLPDDFEKKFPGSDRLATECAMNLVLAADTMIDRIAKLVRPHELTPGSGLALAILADAKDALAPNEIASRLIVSRATVTGLLDSLERRGYVRRESDPTDRRMLRVAITARGKKTAKAFRTVVHQNQNSWFRVLGSEEKTRLLEALGTLQASLEQSDT